MRTCIEQRGGRAAVLILRNGYLYDPASGMEGLRDIWIDGGKIVRITQPDCTGEPSAEEEAKQKISQPEQTTVMDLTGMSVAPGLVDIHVHFREPGFTYKEDIESGAKAAAKGGFTTVVLMANTKPAVDNAGTLQ